MSKFKVGDLVVLTDYETEYLGKIHDISFNTITLYIVKQKTGALVSATHVVNQTRSLLKLASDIHKTDCALLALGVKKKQTKEQRLFNKIKSLDSKWNLKMKEKGCFYFTKGVLSAEVETT